MRFVLKAIFFLAIVAAFIPRQPHGEAHSLLPAFAMTPPSADAPVIEAAQTSDNAETADGADTAVMDMNEAAGAFCESKPALCRTARESAIAARLVGAMAVQQARLALAEAVAEPAPTPATAENTPAS